jgi:preprotein translocase subunit SecG
MLMTFLLVVHALLALALVGVILMQRSEGGGLGIGGGSGGGLVSARGAADLLTRTTAILATLFIVSSLGLAMLAGAARKERPIDTTLARPAAEAPAAPAQEQVPAAPLPADLPPIQQ